MLCNSGSCQNSLKNINFLFVLIAINPTEFGLQVLPSVSGNSNISSVLTDIAAWSSHAPSKFGLGLGFGLYGTSVPEAFASVIWVCPVRGGSHGFWSPSQNFSNILFFCRAPFLVSLPRKTEFLQC